MTEESCAAAGLGRQHTRARTTAGLIRRNIVAICRPDLSEVICTVVNRLPSCTVDIVWHLSFVHPVPGAVTFSPGNAMKPVALRTPAAVREHDAARHTSRPVARFSVCCMPKEGNLRTHGPGSGTGRPWSPQTSEGHAQLEWVLESRTWIVFAACRPLRTSGLCREGEWVVGGSHRPPVEVGVLGASRSVRLGLKTAR